MIDYYAVLMVEEHAGERQLRSAFRRMAKKYHPDLNSHRRAWAHRQMKKLLAAYAVLADEAKRAAYDKKLDSYRNSRRDLFRERLAANDDPESRARLILYDLLNDKPNEAVDRYETTFLLDAEFDVADFLAPRDWMDCKFLLAEQYEARKAYIKALHLYEAIYYSPLANGHYKHFMVEVSDRIRNLCCRDLARSVSPADAIGYYERALRMGLRRTQKAFLHKKMAECYCEAGAREDALDQMAQALKLNPDLKGRQKICKKLGLEPEDGT